MKPEFSDYGLRNLQAKLLARLLMLVFTEKKKDLMQELIEEVTELISDGEYNQIDMAIRTMIFLLEQVEDEVLIKDFYHYTPQIL